MSEMRIGNNYMVNYKMVGSSVWHQEYFVDDVSARRYANETYINGATVIELYKRARCGYALVKAVKQSENIARAKKQARIESIAKAIDATIQ